MSKRSVSYLLLGLGIAALSSIYSGCAQFKISKPNYKQIEQVNDYLKFTEKEFFTFDLEIEIPKIEKVFSEDEITCVAIYDELKKLEPDWKVPSYVSLLSNRLELKLVEDSNRKEKDSKSKNGLEIIYSQLF